MASLDKAIPTRPFIPGSTTIRDREGADITLNQNTIKLNTLQDVSSILVTNPINLDFPSKNFTTIQQTDFSNYTLINPTQSISSSLPTFETVSIELRKELIVEETVQATLPDIEPNFAYLYDDELTGVAAKTDYVGITVDIKEELQNGRAANGTYPTTVVKYNQLNSTQKSNFDLVVKALKAYGFDEIEIKAIVSVVAKETGFVPKKENQYNTTSNSRIREIFSVFANKTDEEINKIKANSTLFWDYVYGYLGPNGKQYNQTKPGEGEKYLGRSFNGITFKTIYQSVQNLYNKLGSKAGKVDIVANPTILETNLNVAAYMTAVSFLNAKNTWFKNKKFTNVNDAIYYYIKANAGWGVNENNIIFQEGLAKAKLFSLSLPQTL
jgi:hypothetical protein